MQALFFHPSVMDLLDVLHPDVREELARVALQLRENKSLRVDIEILEAEEIAPDAVELRLPLYADMILSAFHAEYRSKAVIFFAYQVLRHQAGRSEDIVDKAQNCFYDCQKILDTLGVS